MGSFERIQVAALIPPAAFVDTRWRIVYSAACEIRNAGTPVCAESVSDFIAFSDLDKEFQHAIDSTKTFDWHHWPDQADQSLAFSGPAPLEYCLSELSHLYARRQASAIGKQLAEGELELLAAITSLQEIGHANGNSVLPQIVSATSLCQKPPPTPPEVIHGILHQGGKMTFGGGSKSFKTWMLLELSICVATGSPWLGFDTTQGNVLYLNFELPAFAIANRLHEITTAMKIEIPANLSLWNLRGYGADAATILPLIAREAKASKLLLLVLDPLYKLLGSRDENASRDMADLMNQIERLALEINSAVAFGSHFAKGNASLKESIDRISGSGVFARDPDSILTLTQHEASNAFTLDMTLRNFPQQESFVVRRSHPLMIVDGQLDPSKLKKPAQKNTGRPREHEAEDLLNCLCRDMTSSEWEKACEDTGIPRRTYYRLRKELVVEGRVFQSQIDEKWSRK